MLLFNAPCKTGHLQIDEATVQVVAPSQLLWSAPRNSITYIGLETGPMATLTIYTAQYTFPASGITQQDAQRFLSFFPGVPVGLPVQQPVPVAAQSTGTQWHTGQLPPNGQPSPYPTYNPQTYPPQQPKPPTATQSIMKFIALLRKRPILIIPVALLVLIVGGVVITAAIQGVSQGQQQDASATATANAQQAACCAAPTAAPTAAKTSAPALFPATQGTTLLGSPMSNFVGKLGQPNDHSTAGQDYHFLRVPGQNLDGLIIAFYPGTQQAGDITVATPDPGWTATVAQTNCMVYMPPDAHFKQKFLYTSGSGYDMVYTSASLAKLFPASDFSDGNSNQVAAGTFDVSYLYALDKQHIGSCDMVIGEQQTNL